jgi:hypothetical protein
LLLLLDERLLLLPALLPSARSLCALLFCVLALPPLLAACARLIFPDEEEDGLEDAEEEELRDAIACSFEWNDCQSRQTGHGNCRRRQPFRVGIALPLAIHLLTMPASGRRTARMADASCAIKSGTVSRTLSLLVGAAESGL